MAEQQKKPMTMTWNQALTTMETHTMDKVQELKEEQRIDLPANYSAGNALQQLICAIQDDENVRSCTQASIEKCMLDMIVLGLNPSKHQCYAITYGKTLKLMPSYLGNAATAKRIDPTIKDVVGKAIHVGEDFDFEDDLESGYSHIIKHKRSLKTMTVKDPNKDIVGAYATIVYNDGKEPVSMIMTFEEIKKRWEKSQIHPIDKDGNVRPGTTHYNFPDSMAVRTLINAICTPIIAKSDDASLFVQTAQSVSMDAEKAGADQEAEANMCSGEMVDVDVDFTETDIPEENSENGVDNDIIM